MNDVIQQHHNRQLATWLLVCASVIFGMIVLGGVTRLTGSGLSMVEWKPLMGAIPPLTEEHWQETFAKYQQYPEYQKVNQTMDLAGFKRIFAYEYAHRLLGRLIGLIFFIPLVFFWWTKRIPPQHVPKLIGLFVLGGLQGLLGWYMVKSGLVDIPRVSQYRLVAHLGLAVIIYGFMVWIALDLLYPRLQEDTETAKRVVPGTELYPQSQRDTTAGPGLRRFAFALTGLLFVMILSGGLVSGIHAGFAYNTFPLMDGRFFPLGLYGLEPVWASAFEDITTVQFNHRMLAYLLVIAIVTYFTAAMHTGVSGRARAGSFALLGMLIVQVSLGISTLLLIVPVPLAAAHQGGAILLLTTSLYLSHSLKVHKT